MPRFNLTSHVNPVRNRNVQGRNTFQEKPCMAMAIRTKYQQGELKGKDTPNGWALKFLTKYQHKDAAKLAIEMFTDGHVVKYQPAECANFVKIQPTAKHAETCFDAIKPFMTESTVLIIPDELKAAEAPVLNWVTFRDEEITVKNGSGQTSTIMSGIFVTGNTFSARHLFADKDQFNGKDSGWMFVREIEHKAINGWVYDAMVHGDSKADIVKSNLSDWAQTRGNIINFCEGFGNDDKVDQEVQTCSNSEQGSASSSIDASEPRLEQELSDADNVMAVAAAVKYELSEPATTSKAAGKRRSRS